MARYVIGLDYGTDSARAVVVNAGTGEILASSVKNYPRWSRGLYCDPQANQWRQHPKDYLEVLEFTLRFWNLRLRTRCQNAPRKWPLMLSE